MSTFSADSISLTYGNSAVALSNVTIKVPRGAVVAILGANGAGKTSLVRAMTGQHGFYRARRSGTVSYDGRDLSSMDTGGIVRAGVVQVPEGRKLFASLTVSENLVCGVSAHGTIPSAEIKQRVDQVLSIFPKLQSLTGSQAGFLSGGEQQMVAIGRALISRPKVLICDELSLGLAPLAIRDIYRTLADLNQRTGMSLVIIEQNARQALNMATYAYVLEVGQVVAEGQADELKQSRDVAKYYLGGH